MIVAAGRQPAAAQTGNATLNASISGLARLSLSSAAISFPDADPDTVPSIQASQGQVVRQDCQRPGRADPAASLC
jgi:hypothetical protein